MVTTMATIAVMIMAIRTALVWCMLWIERTPESPHTLASPCQWVMGDHPTAPVPGRDPNVPKPRGPERPPATSNLPFELATHRRGWKGCQLLSLWGPQAYLAIAPVISPMASVCRRERWGQGGPQHRGRQQFLAVPRLSMHPPHNLSAHLGSCGATEAPPAPHHWPQPTHEDAQQDDVPGEASPADGTGRGELVTAAMWCPPSPIPWGYPQAGTTFPDPNTHTATLWRSQPLPTHRGPWQQTSTR